MTPAEQSTTVPHNTVSVSSNDVGRAKEIHLPGEASMWVFVLGDMVIFAIYYLIFMIERTRERNVFLESQGHLSQNIGLINTLVMLTSSWFVARAVRASRAGDHSRAMKLTTSGILCGALFILIKVYEWSTEINRGFTLPKNDFFMFYFMLTGVHLLHVVMGLIILGIVLRELRNPALRRMSLVESGATFWHMVDMLWIILFALLYVMR